MLLLFVPLLLFPLLAVARFFWFRRGERSTQRVSMFLGGFRCHFPWFSLLYVQASDFVTLAKASSATPIMDEEPPEGCAVHIIDDQSQVRGSYVAQIWPLFVGTEEGLTGVLDYPITRFQPEADRVVCSTA